MGKIYCISSGSYSEWGIDYCFKSEEKRNKLLEILKKTEKDNYRDYEKYDMSLCDDFIEVEPKLYYELDMDKKSFIINNSAYDDIHICKFIQFSVEKDNVSMLFGITEEEVENFNEEKYRKIYNDYLSKIKYMNEIENIPLKEVFEIISKTI